MNVTILGAGAYGLALSLMASKNSCRIKVWTSSEEKKNLLKERRENEKDLKGIKLPEEIEFTTDLQYAVLDSELIIIAVASAYVEGISEKLKNILKNNQHVCIASKGIEKTGLLLPEIFNKYNKTDNVAVLSGPSFAIDMANMVPVGLTLATKSLETEKIVKKALQSNLLNFKVTDDLIGTCICGSIKNVIAIATGMLEGMGYPESTKAMFLTEAFNDIKNLIKALGGSEDTICSYAGFGDLLLTATSSKSRNFQFGKLIGSKVSKDEIESFINNTTIEGLNTLDSLRKLLKNKNIELPIIELINNIIYSDIKVEKLIEYLNC